jgi:hypothetical protein
MQVELTGAEAGLVAYWKFNEGAGQAAADSAPGGLIGWLGAGAEPDSSDPAWTTVGLPSP